MEIVTVVLSVSRISKLLFKVSIYQCGCTFRFIPVGSNIVQVPQQVRTHEERWYLWALCHLGFFRFEWRNYRHFMGSRIFQNEERFSGFNQQFFVLQE